MIPLWESVIAPVVAAAGARRMVAVGSFGDASVRRVLDALGEGAELHVVDPVPGADREDHRDRTGAGHHLHRGPGLEVLGSLPPFDVALIEAGTEGSRVRREVDLLVGAAPEHGVPPPVVILSGVRTVADDLLLAGRRRALRTVTVPVHPGLVILVEEECLDHRPALRAFLDHLEGPEGRDMLLELSESLRDLEVDELAGRYIDQTVRALVDEHYLENEVRLMHLADCVTRPKPVELPRLRDPQRHDQETFDRLRRERRHGPGPSGIPTLPTGYAYAPAGRLGLDHLVDRLDRIRAGRVAGELFSCAEDRGGAGILLRAYLVAHGMTDRDVWLAGRWRAAADERSAPDETDGLAEMRPDLNLVRDAFDRFGLLDDRVHLLQGDLAATLPDAPVRQLALLHLGPGLGRDTRTVLDHLYPLLSPGGHVVVDDPDPEVRGAIEDFRAGNGITEPLERVGARGLTWCRETGATPAPSGSARAAPVPAGRARAPLAPPARDHGCDLSVVVVFHDMQREAARTLHSLSRAYQEGVEDLTYEVIAVENGSPAGRAVGEDLVRSFGPEFRYIDLGDDASPTPATALNHGIRASSGAAVALMVDGAHLLSPGVLRHAATALRSHERAVVAVQPWYLGPGQQGEAMRDGYDQAEEDALLERVGWPTHGYGLFEVAHLQGDRDVLDGLWESNCLIVPRPLLEQVGGFDEGFDSPGGGYTNLDVYERLAAAPDVTLVTILGEGSFHQVHGGTTTNQADPSERRARVFSYGERYAELRGRPYSGPEKPIHYVGAFPGDAARRTRARRMTAGAFAVDERLEGADGPARSRQPMPDDLRDGFVAAYWRTLAWRRTRWMGTRTPNAPTDLLTYQDLVHEVRPDWIIETGTRTGGRALFLAGVCDLIGSGRIVSIDSRPSPELPSHPRITYLTGRAHDDEVVDQVRDIVGAEGTVRGLVVLGTRGARRRMHREFEVYSAFVPVGSYVVMEHTVLNGYPVDASFGPGPFEALRRILNTRGDFESDTRREEHGLTFNPGGFLRRIK